VTVRIVPRIVNPGVRIAMPATPTAAIARNVNQPTGMAMDAPTGTVQRRSVRAPHATKSAAIATRSRS